jgi:hypothetical protein
LAMNICKRLLWRDTKLSFFQNPAYGAFIYRTAA